MGLESALSVSSRPWPVCPVPSSRSAQFLVSYLCQPEETSLGSHLILDWLVPLGHASSLSRSAPGTPRQSGLPAHRTPAGLRCQPGPAGPAGPVRSSLQGLASRLPHGRASTEPTASSGSGCGAVLPRSRACRGDGSQLMWPQGTQAASRSEASTMVAFVVRSVYQLMKHRDKVLSGRRPKLAMPGLLSDHSVSLGLAGLGRTRSSSPAT